MVKKKKSRLTNIELLRIIAMLMIVIFHIVIHCVNVQLTGGDSIIKTSSSLFNHPVFYKKLFILNSIMTWGSIGNALFLIISGYFLVSLKNKINIIKISKKLLLQLGFASIVLVIGSTILYKINVIQSFIQLIDINSFNYLSWYVGYYFAVILLAYLFLNKYLNKFNKKQYITFLIIIFAITQFVWTNQLVNSISNGITNGLSTLLIGVFFYSIGGFIKKYNPFKNIRVISIILIIIIIYALIFISSYNIISTRIENYLIDPSNGISQSLMIFKNTNILTVIISICLFELFSRIKMRNIKFINYIASGTFMVYLIHDNQLFYSLWGIIDWIPILYNNPLKFVGLLLAIALLTFIVGIITYVVYDLFTIFCLKYKSLVLKN